MSLERRAVGENRRALVAPRLLDRRQHLAEGRAAPARLRRPIRAAKERRAVGGQEHGERPASLFAQRMQRGHIMMIDVGALLAIDLHTDEARVHLSRGLLVLERFVRHHVAPMARRVADRDEDGAIPRPRFVESRFSPGAPVNGIFGVLKQVGRGLPRELVLRHEKMTPLRLNGYACAAATVHLRETPRGAIIAGKIRRFYARD